METLYCLGELVHHSLLLSVVKNVFNLLLFSKL